VQQELGWQQEQVELGSLSRFSSLMLVRRWLHILNLLVLLLFLVAPSQIGMIPPTMIVSVSGQIMVWLVLLGRPIVEEAYAQIFGGGVGGNWNTNF